MHLENISLSHFKNYRECRLQFSPDINCIVGPNGAGKTNLLDAIHYLSLTKSAFNNIDQQNIAYDAAFFSIRGVFRNGKSTHHLQCSIKAGGKKVFEIDKQPYAKLREHIGLFPSVLITPYDTDIIREGSESRRRFLNTILSQIDRPYLDTLLKYQHQLKQRNQLLKQFALKQNFDAALLDSYNQTLLQNGRAIFEKRKDFVDRFRMIFRKHYAVLSSDDESVDLTYKSDWHQYDFEQLFLDNQQKDLLLQRTTLGIHKDDLVCNIEGHSLRKYGSQGQQKSYVIAMKLAQFEILREIKNFKPLLLLDDIFDKLDDTRIQKLMTMVAGQVFGQLFITDARPERTSRILEHISGDKRVFQVQSGQILEM